MLNEHFAKCRNENCFPNGFIRCYLTKIPVITWSLAELHRAPQHMGSAHYLTDPETSAAAIWWKCLRKSWTSILKIHNKAWIVPTKRPKLWYGHLKTKTFFNPTFNYYIIAWNLTQKTTFPTVLNKQLACKLFCKFYCVPHERCQNHFRTKNQALWNWNSPLCKHSKWEQ